MNDPDKQDAITLASFLSHQDDTAAYVAGLLMGNEPEPPHQQPMHTMSLRLPLEMAAYVFELASTSEKSRVEMARLLIQAGIDSVLQRLPPEIAYETREGAFSRLADMISEN